jgi:hypothetical protein
VLLPPRRGPGEGERWAAQASRRLPSTRLEAGRGLVEPVGTFAGSGRGLLPSSGGNRGGGALGITVGCEKWSKPPVLCVGVGLFFFHTPYKTCALYRTGMRDASKHGISSDVLINGPK